MASFYRNLVTRIKTCLNSTLFHAPLLIGFYVYNYFDWPKYLRAVEKRLHGNSSTDIRSEFRRR